MTLSTTDIWAVTAQTCRTSPGCIVDGQGYGQQEKALRIGRLSPLGSAKQSKQLEPDMSRVDVVTSNREK